MSTLSIDPATGDLVIGDRRWATSDVYDDGWNTPAPGVPGGCRVPIPSADVTVSIIWHTGSYSSNRYVDLVEWSSRPSVVELGVLDREDRLLRIGTSTTAGWVPVERVPHVLDHLATLWRPHQLPPLGGTVSTDNPPCWTATSPPPLFAKVALDEAPNVTGRVVGWGQAIYGSSPGTDTPQLVVLVELEHPRWDEHREFATRVLVADPERLLPR